MSASAFDRSAGGAWLAPSRPGWERRLLEQRPFVSIVTPSFNHARYLERTITSVLSQGYDRLEYIVMDGGSTDGSVDIIRRYADRLAHWVSEPDGGQVDAIVRGMQRSTGDIVAYLNSDDAYLDGALATAIRGFAEQPTPGLVYGEVAVVDEGDVAIGEIGAPEFDIDALVFGTLCVMQPAAFFLREALREVGPFAPDLDWVFDWDMFIRLGRRFRALAMPARLAVSRDHPATKTNTGGFARCEEMRRLVERHGGQPFTLGSLHHYMWQLERALAVMGFGERSRLHWEVRLVQSALRDMLEEGAFLHRGGAGAPLASPAQREQKLLGDVVERDAEIRRLTGVLAETAAVRDREILRLQGVLAEAVEDRDREIVRLRAALAEGVDVRDREIARLRGVLAEAVAVRDHEITRLGGALADGVDVRDREIFRLQAALATAVEVRDREIRRLQAALEEAVDVRDREIARLRSALGRLPGHDASAPVSG
jgi:hypothetical protein